MLRRSPTKTQKEKKKQIKLLEEKKKYKCFARNKLYWLKVCSYCLQLNLKIKFITNPLKWYVGNIFLHEIHSFSSRIRILIPIQVKYMYDVLYVHFLSIYNHFREISNTKTCDKKINNVLNFFKKYIFVYKLPFIVPDLQSANWKLDIFEVIRTQNVLTYERYLCSLQ